VWISSEIADEAPITIKVVEFDSGVNTFIENKIGEKVNISLL